MEVNFWRVPIPFADPPGKNQNVVVREIESQDCKHDILVGCIHKVKTKKHFMGSRHTLGNQLAGL
jgi:hypothetical protein